MLGSQYLIQRNFLGFFLPKKIFIRFWRFLKPLCWKNVFFSYPEAFTREFSLNQPLHGVSNQIISLSFHSYFERLFDRVVSSFLFRPCFSCLERLHQTTRLVNSRNTNITSLSRWKRKWFLLPDSTAEPRGLNVHAHEEQGSLKDSNYTEDFPYTLLDRQLMCFKVFQDVEFLMAEVRQQQEWSHIVLTRVVWCPLVEKLYRKLPEGVAV